MVLEANDISALGSPSLSKLGCTRSGHKRHSIRTNIERERVSQVVNIIVSARRYGGLTVHIPIGVCRWLESLELLRLGISVVW